MCIIGIIGETSGHSSRNLWQKIIDEMQMWMPFISMNGVIIKLDALNKIWKEKNQY